MAPTIEIFEYRFAECLQTARSPTGARACVRVMLRWLPASSRNTRFSTGISLISSKNFSFFSMTSALSRSVAREVFFIGDLSPLKRSPDRRLVYFTFVFCIPSISQFGKGSVGFLLNKFCEITVLAFKNLWQGSACMRHRINRALGLFKRDPSTNRIHAYVKLIGNLLISPFFFVSVNDTLAKLYR